MGRRICGGGDSVNPIPVLSASEAAAWDSQARTQYRVPSRVLMETAGRAVAQVPVAVDALLGTGAVGPAKGEVLALAQRLEGYGAPILAVDGPTGLDLTSGEAHGPVRAHITVTFGGPRRGHLLAREWCGKVVIVDIGFPPPDTAWPVLVTDAWAAERLPRLAPQMHKGDRGRVCVVGGADGMSGAALHAARAALAAGAGLVKLGAARETITAAQASLPDVLTVESSLGEQLEPAAAEALEGADAVVLGPGLGREPRATRDQFVRQVLACRPVPTVLDADALHLFRADVPTGSRALV